MQCRHTDGKFSQIVLPAGICTVYIFDSSLLGPYSVDIEIDGEAAESKQSSDNLTDMHSKR